ncbi:hypothetical protein YFHUAIHA_CDS0056 [Phage C48C1]|nr:hypothetical protein YFHUAIHA_CDS0056 [Phage C48C1]
MSNDDFKFIVRNGIDITGDAEVTGTVTANAFVGDGSGLTGISGGGSSTVSGTVDGHLIPDTNSAYDLGSAEYKFRHLYLSNNSLYAESGRLSFEDGQLTFRDDPVLMLSEVKSIAAESETFEEFKAALASL